MERSITLKVSALLSENGFSLDELIVKTKELFDREGIAGFVSLLLELVDAQLCWKLIHQPQGWQPKPCCERPAYELQNRVRRRIRTSIGVIHLSWRRLRCRHCDRSFLPLREFLGLRRYQSKSSELERIVTEVVSEQSYRRSSRHLNTIGLIPVPKTTAHRWVTLSDCDQIPPITQSLPTLLADGTGYKRRPDAAAGLDNHGEVRVALGVDRCGTVMPLGAWTDKRWTEISQALTPDDPERQVRHTVLVSDGGPGLAEGLAGLANHYQRCQWHQVHDLDYYLYRDDAPKAYRREQARALAGIIGIELPATDFQHVPAADKAALAQTTDEAEQQLLELINQLAARGYHQAANYIRNAKDRLFTYIRVWLAYGIVTPRVSSLLERMMREIGRRLKRMAFGWSEAGAAQMARIIIKRFTTAGEWKAYWDKRLRITGQVKLTLRTIKAV